MSNRTILQFTSTLLKICAVLAFVFVFLARFLWETNYYLTLPSPSVANWGVALPSYAENRLRDLLLVLLALGVAKVIDLLLAMTDDVRDVAAFIQQVRKKQLKQQVQKQEELPHSPDGATAWKPKFRGFRVNSAGRIPKYDPLDQLFRDKYDGS